MQERVQLLLDGPDPAFIVQAGHPVLRARAEEYNGQLSDGTFRDLIELMRRTMYAAPGVGLAAPQIGLPLALAVIEDPGAHDVDVVDVRERSELPFRVLVNPSYEPVGTERVSFYEGCLSISGWQAVVARHRSVRLTGADETGQALDEIVTGWPARIVQHETDHLRGMLYIDRAELRSLIADEGIGAILGSEPSPTTAARVLGFDLA
ncbi:peptide deformylase [Pengzhenrongella frigida]|uniref:Peptide deformylase n=1 Tax=Pengzhenrongella frigida TaxID=1259133 RepID=A0A4Q5MZA8_9MICO|nr:peptide deformylase [Cellulomonas sp. HLT2-17]RYV51088.1 peptide deformylase [Cellulomonas sp. HLT2-17]